MKREEKREESNREEDLKFPFKETELTKNEAKLKFLIESVKESFGRDFTCKLLYRASRDGWLTSDFHRLCDEKGPTVVLVKVSNGRLCGGYCSIGWKDNGGDQHDFKSFLFSLDCFKKYNDSQQVHLGHINWYIGNGPWFGYGALGFKSPMNDYDEAYCRTNTPSLTVPRDSQG